MLLAADEDVFSFVPAADVTFELSPFFEETLFSDAWEASEEESHDAEPFPFEPFPFEAARVFFFA